MNGMVYLVMCCKPDDADKQGHCKERMDRKAEQRNIGLNFYKEPDQGSLKAHIKVWAPKAKTMSLKVAGQYIPLEKQEHGYWFAETDQVQPKDRYWFVLDGTVQLADPASLSQPDGVHNASEALNLDYKWQDRDWKNIPLQDYIFYELHTGTFSESGDFSGIAKHLDHLLDLGVTAIEIMPVAAFPGTRNWGYDGVFPFAVQNSYGGAAELQKLVSLCHEKGLAVVLDVVYNHVGPEGNYLGQFGPYFTDKYQTPWGNAINFDDQDCDGVREYIVENVLMWFRDFHIDALRLDAVHAIKDFSAVQILQEIRTQVDLLMQDSGRIHYLIAESDLNDPRFISSVTENGLGMNAQWVDEFHHALRVTAGEKKIGYYSDFEGIAHLAKSYQDAYVYTGMYSPERKKTFGKKAGGHPGAQFIVFSQNHDQVGNRMLGERSGTLFSFEMQKLMAAAVFCSPFLPMLFMGEEWGEINPFLYFIDHTDEQVVEMVRNGRKAEFAAMHGAGEPVDPKAETTFNASKLNWTLLSGEGQKEKDTETATRNSIQHKYLFDFYKYMIALRKKNVLLSAGDRDAVRVQVFKEKNSLVLERGLTASKEVIVCLMNFSDEAQELILPPHVITYTKIADSAAPEWMGQSAAPAYIHPEAGESQTIQLQPESFIAYSAFYV
ncbi:maltooligosyltrehalose trehalohydrolase [Pedobacter cryoconitis]|uniref:malto-oligosyltrehalose trehalohydrolase n=1 Tax=Pedobacter cryoconitis TaxID=188932 RepID=UPI0017A9BB99|nr:malto-oligosyltrehalose trehalohydrolase [Pedobacter cryoconitis]MBB6272461.1 maltooligosyltrehalose trehalohydrolase [Pedobacter cryoconitis]